MIGVDVNATADTLTEIMNWFQSGNNVAVSRCDQFMNLTYISDCVYCNVYKSILALKDCFLHFMKIGFGPLFLKYELV